MNKNDGLNEINLLIQYTLHHGFVSFSLLSDRRLSRHAVVRQHPVLPVLRFLNDPDSCLSPGTLQFLPTFPHQPLQDVLLQIPLLASQTAGKSLNTLQVFLFVSVSASMEKVFKVGSVIILKLRQQYR